MLAPKHTHAGLRVAHENVTATHPGAQSHQRRDSDTHTGAIVKRAPSSGSSSLAPASCPVPAGGAGPEQRAALGTCAAAGCVVILSSAVSPGWKSFFSWPASSVNVKDQISAQPVLERWRHYL